MTNDTPNAPKYIGVIPAGTFKSPAVKTAVVHIGPFDGIDELEKFIAKKNLRHVDILMYVVHDPSLYDTENYWVREELDALRES